MTQRHKYRTFDQNFKFNLRTDRPKITYESLDEKRLS